MVLIVLADMMAASSTNCTSNSESSTGIVESSLARDEDTWDFEDPPQFTPFWFENFDRPWWLQFAKENGHLSIYCAILYILIIFGIQALMRNRPPFKLKKALFVWNLTLGIFSIFGFIRYVPEFAVVLWQSGFHGSLCRREGLNVPVGFWSLLFTLSKLVELGDTIFIVLRKRPLIFLQWYHHAITFIACWNTVTYLEPLSRWYAVMNYGVHAVMYPYFALKTLDFHIPKKIANCLTVAQLSQMIVGLTANIYTVLVIAGGGDCVRHPNSIKLFIVVYGSFTLLFGELLYKAMFAAKPKSETAKTK